MTLIEAPPAPLTPLDVDDLRLEVRGPVLAAGDDGLAAEVATWDTAVIHTPAVAVGAGRAVDPGDVFSCGHTVRASGA
jgi:hypothetical protein